MFLWKKYNLPPIPLLTLHPVAIWSAQWIPIKAFNSLFSSGALFDQAAWWPNHNGLYSPEVIHNPPPVLGHAVMVTAVSPSLRQSPLVSKSQISKLCPLHEWCLLGWVSRKATGACWNQSLPAQPLTGGILLLGCSELCVKSDFEGENECKNESQSLPWMSSVCTTQWLRQGQCCGIQMKGHLPLSQSSFFHEIASSLFFMVLPSKRVSHYSVFSLLAIFLFSCNKLNTQDQLPARHWLHMKFLLCFGVGIQTFIPPF